MYFMRLWAISALAALCGLLVVLFVWLLFHLRFDLQEALDLMSGYVTNARIMALAVGVGALVGLIEAAVIQFWYRQKTPEIVRILKAAAVEFIDENGRGLGPGNAAR